VSIAGLVLAAGESRRLGRPKALLEVGGETLLARAVRVLREGGCADVLVVSGGTRLVVPGAKMLDNPDWATGMGSSLRVGLTAIPRADAVVIMVVDTPGIGADVVRRLRRAHRDGATAVVATYDGEPRNPVLLARRHWAEVIELAVGDMGARAFLARHPELVRQVECGDIADPADIDTPDDLARLLDGPRGS
jgi:CTP:molybdopterin cytidylyltransferase MocA